MKNIGRMLAIAVAFFGIGLSFQNCSPVSFMPTAQDLGSQAVDCVTQPSLCVGDEPRCVFNGKNYGEGQTVIAFLHSTVPEGANCTSETRKCVSGSFTGSYPYASCSTNSPAACLFNGQTILHGQGVEAFQNAAVVFGASCVKENRICNNGVLSGSYNFANCSVGNGAGCLFSGQTIAHGGTVKAFQSGTVPFGQSCQSEDRKCVNGNLSGTFLNSSCNPGQAAPCTFNGAAVAHGQNVLAYLSSSATAPATCTAEYRTCDNGNLSGSYRFGSCAQNQPRSCLFNGVTVAHGQQVVAYANKYASSCVKQNRICQDGDLSGTYGYSSCEPYKNCSEGYKLNTATNVCERIRCPSSYYHGILCEVHVVCPNNKEVGVAYPHGNGVYAGSATYYDIAAQSVSGYINLSGYVGESVSITNASQVDLRVSGVVVRSISYGLRCQSDGDWAPNVSVGSCVVQKNLTASDSRCQ